MAAASPGDQFDRKSLETEELHRRRVDRLETGYDAVTVIDSHGRILFESAAAARLITLFAEGDLGKRPLERAHPDDRGELEAIIRDLGAGTAAERKAEFRVVDQDGRLRWIEASARRLLDDPEIAGIVVYWRDITARKQVEEELQRNQWRLAESQRIARLGSWEWWIDTHAVWWSDELYRIFGLDPSTHTASFDLFMSLLPADARRQIEEHIAAALVGSAPYCFDHSLRRGDGELIWLHAEGIVDRDASGRPVCLRGTSQDITERKRNEDERVMMTSRLQEMQRWESLAVLSGGVAHDFNNLLTPILGFASLAEAETPAGSPVRQHLQRIESAARRAADLCQQMLVYAGRGHCVLAPTDVGRLLSEMLALVQVSLPKQATVTSHLAEDLPLVLGDANQLRQVAMNLILNAGEALVGGQGLIAMTTRRAAVAEVPAKAWLGEVPPGEVDLVCLEVRDTGCGATPQTLGRMFEPFYSTKFAGRGLGLSAVLGIVRRHQGALDVESTVGKGTRFRVWLPACPATQSAVVAEIHPTLVARGMGTVLVVNDDPAERAATVRTLRELDFETLEAPHGREALRKVLDRKWPLAAVVLDANLPRSDAVETWKRLQRIAPRLPVVLVVDSSATQSLQSFARADAAHVLTRPYTWEALARKVRAAVSGAS